MSPAYRLRASDATVEFIRALHPLIKRRVRSALTDIVSDPHCGKALKEDLAGLRSYRIKRFRIVYRVAFEQHIDIIAIGPRKYIYEETFRIISKEEV